MKNITLAIAALLLINNRSYAQLANWTAYQSSKFPTNLSGQIHGQTRICQMKFHPTNANKYYAVTTQGGLFTSNDGGDNWTVSAGTDALAIKTASICIDYTNDQVLYLGGGDPNYYGSGAGIYKSTDGGASFTLLTNASSSLRISSSRLVVEILMHPTDHNTLVAATKGGIYKSTDAGATWTAKTSTSLQFCDMKSATDANSTTLFASTQTTSPEFYRSTDFGTTWTLITSGITAPSVAPIQSGSRIGVTPANSNVVYLGMVSSGGMIFKSTDNGLTFTQMKAGGSPYITFYNDNVTDSGQGNYNFCIGVDRADATKVWLQSHNTWYSSNSGTSWTMLTFWSQKVHTDMHQIGQSPYDATKLYSCNDGGVWLSTDGGNNWTPKSDGIFAYEIADYAGKGSPTNKNFIDIGTQDNGELYGDATGWYTIRGGDWYSDNEMDYRDNSKMIYYGENGKRRTPTGSQLTYGLQAGTIAWSALEFNRTNTNLAFIGLTDTLFRTTDVQSTTPTWTNLIKLNTTIKAIHNCIADANRLYVLTSDQKIQVSTNALSASPTFTAYNLPTALDNTATITAVCNNANTVYIAINNKVYRSADGGQTWTDMTYNLPSVNHRRILSEEYGGTEELVFIATNNAVYYKKAGQTTWTNYSTNLPTRQAPTDLSIFDDGTNNAVIRHASYGRGIWETPFGNLRPVMALASATKSTDVCNGNTFTFNNTSTGVYNSTSWSFPGGSPSSSSANNQVVTYPSVGSYTATLTITDVSNNMISNLVNVNVTRIDNCSPDAYAGKSLNMAADGDYLTKTNANLTNVTTFSTTAWIKPNVAQDGFAGIVSNGEWCAHCNVNTNGLVFDYYGTKLWFRWAGISDTWASNSAMTVPLNQWSYVAMTISPDSVALYLNEQKYVYNFKDNPSVNQPTAASFANLFIGYGHYYNNFKGQIDEVSIWNRVLTQNEIREIRHLTKDNTLLADANLIAYYQFNDAINNTTVLDKKRAYHADLSGNATLVTSTAPVATGTSQRMTITTGGVKDFTTNQHLSLEFPSTGTLPNGEIVVNELTASPDQNPTGGTPLSSKYWIVNNYGANSSFATLTSINFSSLGSFATGSAANFKLYKRASNADGATWGTSIDAADALVTNSDITFSTGNGITSFSQFTISREIILPVEILNLKAQNQGKTNLLTWQTTSEKENEGFDIEKSADGKIFEKIGFVKGNGTTTQKQTYSFTDNNPLSISYYRLHQMDFGGKETYSNIVSVVMNTKMNVKAFPNPTNSLLNVQFDSETEQNTDIELIDNLGRSVYSYKLTARIGNNHLFFGTQQFPAGIYRLRIKQNASTIVEQIVIH